jgi:VWFA-related protein
MAPTEGRKVLIVISDGDDNASLSNLRKARKAAQDHEVLIYAVSTHPHVSSDEHLNKPDRILRSLAVETGGQAFFPATSLEFTRSFESISTELRSQFSLAYRSSNPRRDGVFRKIRIEPKHRKWIVRTRKGYFAPAG